MGVLRLTLATAVVCWHGGPFLGLRVMPGDTAVQTFFLLSGFYMALVLHTKYRGPGSYRLFLSNRFLRLFPAYWAVLAATFATCLVLQSVKGHSRLSAYDHPLSPFAFVFLVVTNLAVFGQDAVMFLGLSPSGRLVPTANFRLTRPELNTFLLIPQAWSLGVELTFYLVAPFLARKRSRTVAGLFLASWALRLWIYYGLGLKFDPWTGRFFPTELALFLLGVLSYRGLERLRGRVLPRGTVGLVSLGFLGLTLGFSALPSLPFHGGWLLKHWGYFGLTGLAIPFVFLASENSRLDRYAGDLSYPLYITHGLVLMVFEAGLPPDVLNGLVARSLYTPAVLGCSLLISAALLRFLIDPLERYRQGRVRPRPDRPRVARGSPAPALTVGP